MLKSLGTEIQLMFLRIGANWKYISKLNHLYLLHIFFPSTLKRVLQLQVDNYKIVPFVYNFIKEFEGKIYLKILPYRVKKGSYWKLLTCKAPIKITLEYELFKSCTNVVYILYHSVTFVVISHFCILSHNFFMNRKYVLKSLKKILLTLHLFRTVWLLDTHSLSNNF